MNTISAPRDDQGLIEHHAQRARAGLIPKTGAVRQYPAPDSHTCFEPARAAPMTPTPVSARRAAVSVWRGPERRRRRLPVLLDTRVIADCSIDLLA